jgi:signal transduction histidine kinase
MSPANTSARGSLPLRWRLLLAFVVLAVIDYVLLGLAVWFGSGIIQSFPNSDFACVDGVFGQRCTDFDTPAYWFGCLGLVALVVATWVLASAVVFAPLHAMTDTVRQLGPQNLGHRVRMITGRRDPLRRLADELNALLDRVSAGYESQRGFAANASHELRTPLAVQRTLIEVAMDDPEGQYDLRQLGRNLLAANERNERLIEGLLVLAEVDRGPIAKLPVRLDKIVADVLAMHAELAEHHDVTLRSELADRTVPGDDVLLERLITNLVRNAILYNEPGGRVEVVVGSSPTLVVRNTGERVPAETVPSLFEPFRRGVPDRISQHTGGAGLGLSIVRAIVRAHDGTVHAASQHDGGLAIRVSLPTE